MRKTATILGALAIAAVATPAHAETETRIETRGGVAWANGAEEAVAGVAAGVDFDLGQEESGSVFFGVEASADKILASGADVVWGTTARLGAKVGNGGKIYATGGYSFGEGEDVPHLGAGYEQKLGGSGVYLKGEYRHFFSDFVDVNTAVVGVGYKF
ncbi:hypothetical protein [Pontixanthobacter aquaemixtae]|uniref:Outer membrane protein beta-barrel domain-containing protein n=1 Tax=Pontixanthobacter aquaemixtae TaxID=1958940 RepID=A0A844ZS22_9SPHN|nr:hypothetical protein [Pontixanthobacter aquaemixtae]MXO90538.1 hypothetical protein [Pontixanthobacter aquaemixtae]